MLLLLASGSSLLQRTAGRGLAARGFAVEFAAKRGDMLRRAKDRAYHAILLDEALPGGVELCAVRELARGGPALVVLGSPCSRARVECFAAGADDFVPKPPALDELEARLKLRIRSRAGPTAAIITVGRISLDHAAHAVFVDGRRIELTNTEFRILHTLATRTGQVVSREALVEEVWHKNGDPTRHLTVQLSRLRTKLGPAARQIQTVRGAGLRLTTARSV